MVPVAALAVLQSIVTIESLTENSVIKMQPLNQRVSTLKKLHNRVNTAKNEFETLCTGKEIAKHKEIKEKIKSANKGFDIIANHVQSLIDMAEAEDIATIPREEIKEFRTKQEKRCKKLKSLILDTAQALENLPGKKTTEPEFGGYNDAPADDSEIPREIFMPGKNFDLQNALQNTYASDDMKQLKTKEVAVAPEDLEGLSESEKKEKFNEELRKLRKKENRKEPVDPKEEDLKAITEVRQSVIDKILDDAEPLLKGYTQFKSKLPEGTKELRKPFAIAKLPVIPVFRTPVNNDDLKNSGFDVESVGHYPVIKDQLCIGINTKLDDAVDIDIVLAELEERTRKKWTAASQYTRKDRNGFRWTWFIPDSQFAKLHQLKVHFNVRDWGFAFKH